MCVKSITVTADYVEIDQGGGDLLHFDFADFPPSASTNQKRQDLVIQHVQDWLDIRIPIADIPPDDPYVVNGDPGLPFLFWDGSGANQVVVERPRVIENVVYDPAGIPSPLSFSIRNIWPKQWP